MITLCGDFHYHIVFKDGHMGVIVTALKILRAVMANLFETQCPKFYPKPTYLTQNVNAAIKPAY